MGYGVEQTFGSSFPEQNRRPLSMNSGRLNTLWWIILGMTATIIGAGVFFFLVQSSDEPQDFIAETIPAKPFFPRKVALVPSSDTRSPSRQKEKLLDVPEKLFQPPVTPKISAKKSEKTEAETDLPVVESRPSIEIKSEKKKTNPKVVEKKRLKEIVPSAILPKVVRPKKTPMPQTTNILASMDRQDNNLLNCA